MKHTLHKINLESGAKLLAINVPNSPVIHFDTFVRAGHRFVENEKFELPHLMEHLAFEGNKVYPDPKRFMFEIEKNGAYKNAFTSKDTILYVFSSSVNELKDLTKLAIIQITQPLFKEKSINHEKETVINELNRRISEDSSRLVNFHYAKIIPEQYLIYKNRIKSVKKINRQNILDFYFKTHVAKNFFFVVTGDLNIRKIKWLEDTLNLSLSKFPQGQLAKFEKPKFGRYKKQIDILSPNSENQAQFILSFINERYDYQSAPAISIVINIYNGGMSSRMFQKARKAGLTYGHQANFFTNKDFSSLWIKDDTRLEKIKKLFDLSLNELTGIANGNFTQEELNRAKGFLIGSIEQSFETSGHFADWYGRDLVMDYKIESPQDFISRIKKVTRKDIIQTAKRYITKDNWVLTLMGENLDKEKFRKILDKYLA